MNTPHLYAGRKGKSELLGILDPGQFSPPPPPTELMSHIARYVTWFHPQSLKILPELDLETPTLGRKGGWFWIYVLPFTQIIKMAYKYPSPPHNRHTVR